MGSTSDECKQFVGRYLQALSGHRKTPELVDRFVADPHLRTHIQEVEGAFPEYELIAEDLIAEGDRVAMRGVFRGVQRGPFAGMPATGASVSAPLMIVYRISDNRIVEHWMQFDGAGLVAQLQRAVAAPA